MTVGILCEVVQIIRFTDDQQKIVDYIMEQVELGDQGKNIVISGAGGVGKAQPDDTKIPTPSGTKRLDELVVGDFVFDGHGRPTKVIGIFPQGIMKKYKMTFSDGRIAYCNDEHIWCLGSKKTTHQTFKKTKTLKEIMVDYRSIDNRGYNVYKYVLPVTSKIYFSKKDLPIDPYVLGCFLGDGCNLESALTISSNDQCLVQEIAQKIDATYKKLHVNNYSWSFQKNDKNILTKEFFAKTPEVINYSYEKKIPAIYLYTSESQRYELLSGLFDTDGTARKERASIRYTTTSKSLIEQVRWLVLSLGCHCGKICQDKRDSKYTQNCWYITISGPKEKLLKMFHLQRKKDIVATQAEPRTRYDIITLQNIEYIGDCSMRCIMVDNPDHVYVTEDFIITHNTEMVSEVICLLLSQGHSVAVGAMTGKATAVLRGKIMQKIKENEIQFNKSYLMIETIQKMTKISRVIGLSQDGETIYSNRWKNPEAFDYDVLIIDELSMVPYYVSLWWQRTRSLVIGLGDFCQLPEVLTKETNKEIEHFCKDLDIDFETFKQIESYGIKVLRDYSQWKLTKVLRSDNEIAMLCGELRDFFIGRSKVIDIILKWTEKSNDISYSRNIADLETGKDWQIICYTNKKCQEINNQLCIGGEYPSRDDKVLLFDNIPPIEKYNGDTIIFEDLIRKISSLRQRNKKIYVCFKWQGKMPRKNSKFGIEQQSYQAYVNFKSEYERVQRQRLTQIIPTLRRYTPDQELINKWTDVVIKYRHEIQDPVECLITILKYFETVDYKAMQAIIDGLEKLPQLYMVTLDYGYAITTHKSQGSEYEKVCYVLEKFDRPLLYTGLSRAKKQLKIIDLATKG